MDSQTGQTQYPAFISRLSSDGTDTAFANNGQLVTATDTPTAIRPSSFAVGNGTIYVAGRVDSTGGGVAAPANGLGVAFYSIPIYPVPIVMLG